MTHRNEIVAELQNCGINDISQEILGTHAGDHNVYAGSRGSFMHVPDDGEQGRKMKTDVIFEKYGERRLNRSVREKIQDLSNISDYPADVAKGASVSTLSTKQNVRQ